MKTQLLCTFTDKENLENTIEKIKESYDIVFNKIYVLQDENNVTDFLCTYNVSTESKVNFNDVKGTISLHRKKHSNTLYTINALNRLIEDFKNGVLDKNFAIPWENFKNMVLVTNADGLHRVSTRIYKIIDIEK